MTVVLSVFAVCALIVAGVLGAVAAWALKSRDEMRSAVDAERRQLAPLRKYEQIRNAEEFASQVTAKAEDRAHRLVLEAEARVEGIKREAAEARRVAEAMRNAIAGYGDEYLLPTSSVVDEIASEMDYSEAGRRLKEARKRTRELVRRRTAAACDDPDETRRDAGTRFVIDAFNGKVDSALAGVKATNYGKLLKEIEDAYAIVNHLGMAVGNARVMRIYLEARINELKWAVAARELQVQEREEQRQIKAQMREEERARKEFEKAQREAEKEARLLASAMLEAKKRFAEASEEERSKFQRQIAELEQQVLDAEAKNQRAISMAQQTKRGHVYVISNVGSFGDRIVKIGMTRRLEPLDRVRELSDASVPFDFDVHAMITVEDAPALEKELHERFADRRVNMVNLRREFFELSVGEVRSVLEDRGVETRWTMKAEAREFAESRAIRARCRSIPIKSEIDEAHEPSDERAMAE